jgi:hypothetical protein
VLVLQELDLSHHARRAFLKMRHFGEQTGQVDSMRMGD